MSFTMRSSSAMIRTAISLAISPGRVTAHAVGDDEEAGGGIREERILVARPDHPGVGGLTDFELH